MNEPTPNAPTPNGGIVLVKDRYPATPEGTQQLIERLAELNESLAQVEEFAAPFREEVQVLEKELSERANAAPQPPRGAFAFAHPAFVCIDDSKKPTPSLVGEAADLQRELAALGIPPAELREGVVKIVPKAPDPFWKTNLTHLNALRKYAGASEIIDKYFPPATTRNRKWKISRREDNKEIEA